MKVGLFLLAILALITSFSGAAFATPCLSYLGSGPAVSDEEWVWPLGDAEAIRKELRRLLQDPSLSQSPEFRNRLQTPQHLVMLFKVKAAGARENLRGHIEHVTGGGTGYPVEIGFRPLGESEPRLLRLDQIDIPSIRLGRVLSEREQEIIMASFQEAVQTGQFVEFSPALDSTTSASYRGRIRRIESVEPGSDKHGIFSLEGVRGYVRDYDFGEVYYASIRLFPVTPNKLTRPEAELKDRLARALDNSAYVSLLLRRGERVGPRVVEGWITEIYSGVDGEWRFRLNKFSPIVKDSGLIGGGLTFGLSEIVQSSVKLAPTTSENWEGGPGEEDLRFEAQATLYQGHVSSAYAVPLDLRLAFARYADARIDSGPGLPDELYDLTDNDQEVVFHFSGLNGVFSGKKSYLMVRRQPNGEWIFSDSTGFVSGSEEVRGDRLRDLLRAQVLLRYPGSSEGVAALPAARLRFHLRRIFRNLGIPGTGDLAVELADTILSPQQILSRNGENIFDQAGGPPLRRQVGP